MRKHLVKNTEVSRAGRANRQARRASLSLGAGILSVFLAACSGGGGGSVSSGMPVASVAPGNLTFPNQTVDTTSAAESVTLSNTGSATLAVTSIIASGDFGETNNCGSTLAGGASCTVDVTFTPTTVGTLAGAITVTDNAPSSGSQQVVSLTGTGVSATGPAANLSTTSLTFGNQTASTASTPQSVMLTNTGGQALNINSIVASAGFAETNNCGASVAGGRSCAINIAFAPTVSGPLAGTITIADNAGSGLQTVSATGVAVDGLGSVTGMTIGCGSGVTATCFSLNISSCPGVADMDGVTLRVKGPSGTPVGTIILGTGLGGVGFYEDVFKMFGKTVITSLVNAGFTTVQISFTGTINGTTAANGWLTGPGGPRKLACRYASAAQWVYQNIHNSNAAAPYCATGNSGGSAAIGYSLAHYGLDSIFAMVEPTSGPVMGRVDHGCVCNQPPVPTAATGCPNAQPLSECYQGAGTLLDAAYGSSICSEAISTGDTTNAALFLNDSIASPDANLSYPKTAVHCLYGGQDMSSAVPQGLDWATIILTNHTIACVPTAPHSIPDDANGANMIATDLINSCKLQ